MATSRASHRTVLLLHSSAGRYGADRQLLSIATGLDRSRYRALVVLPERGELAALLEAGGVETAAAPMAVLRRALLNPRGLAGLAARARHDRQALGALARRRGVALVHLNTSVILSGPAVARAAGSPCLVHVREIYRRTDGAADAALWPLMRHRLLAADGLACVSAATARPFGASERVFVLPDGLTRLPSRPPRAEARAALGLASGAFVVAVLGRISSWKGQDLLARALAAPALADIGAVGLVAGDAFAGAERHERGIRELRDRLGLGERLRLLGFRGDPDLVMAAADVVAVPSIRPDPLPNSALEAAAAGAVVVAADHGGLPEILRDGVTGRLVPPGDHHALAGVLRELAEQPALARALGRAAAEDVGLRFDRRRMLADLQAHYDRLLGLQGRR